MKMSRDGIELLKRFEGCKLTAYQDSVGVWTIGYGTTEGAGFGPITKGMKISQATADDWLVDGLSKYERAVSMALVRSPTQNQFDAMVSLCYNIGPGAFAGSTVCRAFNAGKIAMAANGFLLWNKAKGKVLKGLTARRAAEMALFMKPADHIAGNMVSEPAASVVAPDTPDDHETPVAASERPLTGEINSSERNIVMKGFKTIIIGLLMAVIPIVTQYLGAIDWSTALPQPWGLVVGGLIMIAMRFVTTTPVMKG